MEDKKIDATGAVLTASMVEEAMEKAHSQFGKAAQHVAGDMFQDLLEYHARKIISRIHEIETSRLEGLIGDPLFMIVQDDIKKELKKRNTPLYKVLNE